MPHRLESEVRYYSRYYTDRFARAEGPFIYTEDGREFLDFFSAAGSLNYGHNHPDILAAVTAYLNGKGLIAALDMDTTVREQFLETFANVILSPRSMKCRVQFPGPTGTNAVEAALKLARKYTGRHNIFAFHGSYHGMTLGSLAATGGKSARAGAGANLGGVTFVPFPAGAPDGMDTLSYIELLINDPLSGVEKPAAILLETIQAEGGVNVAPAGWLRGLRELCTQHGILMIVDDIQVGCGRTGKFFSCEHAGVQPDITILSKSISGLGLALSLVLLREDIDVWSPGEHTGTFRSNSLSLAGGLAALSFWSTPEFEQSIHEKEKHLRDALDGAASRLGERFSIRGLGMILGLAITGDGAGQIAEKTKIEAYRRGLIIETAGRDGSVVKLLPSLTMGKKELDRGIAIIEESAAASL